MASRNEGSPLTLLNGKTVEQDSQATVGIKTWNFHQCLPNIAARRPPSELSSINVSLAVSCQATEGHCFPKTTVNFETFRLFSYCYWWINKFRWKNRQKRASMEQKKKWNSVKKNWKKRLTFVPRHLCRTWSGSEPSRYVVYGNLWKIWSLFAPFWDRKRLTFVPRTVTCILKCSLLSVLISCASCLQFCCCVEFCKKNSAQD